MNKVGLTEANFIVFAAKHYDSVFYDDEEFLADLKRFGYIKRLFRSYKNNGELKERLILNHIIVIYNMWGIGATPMLFLKLKGFETYLVSFLLFLNRMPNEIAGIGIEHRTIKKSEIPADLEVLRKLHEL